ncbi:MAG: hypothetical protein SV239_13285 [Thermodesulfobacteriota bacterium]|jgi:hypothetical protein|nr:hypothetical protein [Thermodesulfobacteriota bacterium]
MRGFVRYLFFLLLPGLVMSCATAPEMPQVKDPSFAARGIKTVALQPVIFRGSTYERPMTYCERDIPNQLRFHLGRFLEQKGYRVKRIDRPPQPHSSLPDPLATENPYTVLAQTPMEADAVLVVWVDHYKHLGLCEHVRAKGLEIQATAALFSVAESAEIWRNSASESDFSSGDPVTWVTHRVPLELLLTLPDAP